MRTRARACVGAWVRVSVCACVRVRAFCERSSAPYAAHRGHGTRPRRDTSLGGVSSGRPARVWGIYGGLSQRQRAERHNLRPSVSQQGRQTDRGTHDLRDKGRTGHRKTHEPHREPRRRRDRCVGQRAAGRARSCGSTDHGIRLRHLCMQVVLVEECKPSGARLPEGLLVSKLPAILV